MQQKELERIFSGFGDLEPFASSSFPKKIARKEIQQFLQTKVESKVIYKKKIGSMYIYWKIASSKPVPVKRGKPATEVTGDIVALTNKVRQLEGEKREAENLLSELEDRLEEEKEKNARLRKIDAVDGIDSEWEEVVYRMGEAIAHRAGLTLKEVLKQFGAPDTDT